METTLTQTEPMLTFKYGKIEIETFWNGGANVSYKMTVNRKVIAAGNDFRPSSLYNIDDVFTMVTLISFMTVRLVDTDKEYFNNHTPEHMEWLDADICDMLRLQVSYYEDKDSEYHKKAIKFFNKYTKNLV